MQAGYEFFNLFYEDVVDEKNQFMKNQKSRLEKLEKEVDATKMEIENLRAANEELKQQLRELQIQMMKMVNWENFGNIMFCIVLCVLVFRML